MDRTKLLALAISLETLSGEAQRAAMHARVALEHMSAGDSEDLSLRRMAEANTKLQLAKTILATALRALKKEAEQ